MSGRDASTLLVAAIAFGCGRIGFDVAPDSRRGNDGATSCSEPAGAIGHWSMDSVDVSGTSVIDRSGRAAHGTLTGATLPAVSPGRVGEALDFSMTTHAWVDLPTLPLDMTPGGFNTVAMWFKRDPAASVDEGLVAFPSIAPAAPPLYDLWFTDYFLGPISLCTNSGESNCWGQTDVELLGRWVHVAIVVANGRLDQGTQYVDGLQVSATCLFGMCNAVRTAQNPVTIGAIDSNYAWHGQIDDVWIFDHALTATEVQELYACAP